MATLDEKYEIEATITENGVIRPVHFQLYKRLFQKFVGKPIVVSVQVLRKNRSARQNRYYWGCVIPMIRAFHLNNTGELLSPDEVHVFNISCVIGEKPTVKEVMGQEVILMTYKKSSQMTTTEFNEFTEIIRKYWADRGCDIPEPNEENLLIDLIK